MDTSGEIFVGITKSHLRALSFDVFSHLFSSGYEQVILPAVGEFNLASIAIEAGFKPENIYASDISAFSSVLGYVFSNQSIDSLGLTLSPIIQKQVDAQKDDIGKAAVILYNMRLIKLRRIAYRANLLKEFILDKEKMIEDYRNKLTVTKNKLDGINYEVVDMRKVIKDYGKKTVIVSFPPLFAGGYGKMFDFEGEIDLPVDIEEFLPKEFPALFNSTKPYKSVFLTFSDKFVAGISNEDIAMVKEYKVGKYDVCYVNHLEAVPENTRGKILTFSRHKLSPLKVQVFSDNDTITRDSVIKFHQMKAENALYYRELWIHNLGVTTADSYYGLTIDGKLFAVCGVMASGLSGLSTNYIFEQFGVAVPSKKYPGLARLLEWCMTSSDFKKVLYKTITSINRVYEISGVKTVCLSKNAKVKSHHGIFDLLGVKFEKKLNMNKLEYYARFRKDNVSVSLGKYLDELKKKGVK